MTAPNSLVDETIRSALHELQSFAATAPFRRLLAEMSSVPPTQRHEFVSRVILSDAELEARGVIPPPGITLQRSWFADDRPTLFCMTKHLPDGVVWEKVTITFDNRAGEPAVRFSDVAGGLAAAR